MQEKIRKLEEVWGRQDKFFPGLFSSQGRYFPMKFEYYRYISETQVSRYLEQLDKHINILKEKRDQIGRALEWSALLNEEEYSFFLASFGWVLAASGYVLECWRDVANLKGNYDKIITMGDDVSLDGRIEILNEFYDTIHSQLYHLTETIDAIKYVTSLEPKPTPFFVPRRYETGEIVVGIYERDGMNDGVCAPYALKIKDNFSMYGDRCVYVRPLSEDELAMLPIDLPTRDCAYWMRNIHDSWIIPLEVYCFYSEHPEVLAEHRKVLVESGLLVPVSYEALSMHFGV